ncbi:MAG: EAL domain-containing protein [Leptospirillia bacterium]
MSPSSPNIPPVPPENVAPDFLNAPDGALFEGCPLPLCLLSSQDTLIAANAAFRSLLLPPGQSPIGLPINDYDTRTETPGETGDAHFRRFDGKLVHVTVKTTRLDLAEQTIRLLTLLPVSDPARPDAKFQQDSPAGLISLKGDRTIQSCNPAFGRMTGYAADEILSLSPTILLDPAESLRKFERFILQIEEHRNASETFLFRKKYGEPLFVAIAGTLCDSPEETPAPIDLVVLDISPLYLSQKKMERQLSQDPMTRLPNRAAFDHAINGALARARRKGLVFGVGVLDIDDFRPLNETLGKGTGDRILEELARRLKLYLRQSDFLARLSGDEFGLIIEELSLEKTMSQVASILDQLHKAVEEPFPLPSGRFLTLGISMGMALYPSSGEDGESLFREAEAALYQSKATKASRTQWWSMGSILTSASALEAFFDAYGPESQRILSRHHEHIQAAIVDFVEAFLAQNDLDSDVRRILAGQDEAGLQRIVQAQSAHLSFLMTPERTREEVNARAKQVGEIHALNGVDGAMLAQGMALYRRLLSERLSQTFLTARDRYRLLLANEIRLQDDLQEELRAATNTMSLFFSSLSAPMPEPGALWTDVREKELALLGELPGIRCALLMRLDSQGLFIVESSAGVRGREAAKIMQDKRFSATADPNDPRGQGLIGHAWRSLEIQKTSNYHNDSRLRYWKDVVHPLGIRSGISIPIRSADGSAQAVLSLYGAYPNQFDFHWMLQFSRGLAQRWERVWALSRAPVSAIPETRAQEYRQEIFSGGLSMYMQPVVNLSTGTVVKVEALARLIRPGGEIVPPGLFLPSMGDAELDRLFREGLDQALEWVSRWDAEGVSLDVSLNLPPGTLRDPSCPVWVEEALTRHRVAPKRLTLELLENDEIDAKTMDQAVEHLVAIGVNLSMDDLGSGFSSLQRLVTLPFDSIKVDQGLLKRIRTAPLHTISMIGTIVRMGQDFERDVVVEGLEDRAMVEAAAILGAPYGQGYSLARPMPATQVVQWLQNFHLPITPGEVTTALGGLSFHRWIHASNSDIRRQQLETCPLTRYFSRLGEGGAVGAQLHARMHESEPGDLSFKDLTLWLVEQIRNEQDALAKGQDSGK